MEEEDVRGDRGLSVFRLRAVSRLTLVVRCTEIGYSVSTQVLGFRFGCGWCCVVGFLFGCCWFCVLLLCVSAWWNRGIADEVTMASYGRAVTGTAVMARSANEEKKKNNSCATSFATTKWSCAFHDSLTPFMLCSPNRQSQAGFSPLQHLPLHISPHCQRALNSTLPLLHNSTNLPLQEVKLRRGLLPRLLPPLYLKVSLQGRFLLPLPANSLPARPIPLLLPFAHQ